MAIVKIKKPNGEIMETIDGEYVIGYGEGCYQGMDLRRWRDREVIDGEYLVEGEEHNVEQLPCSFSSMLENREIILYMVNENEYCAEQILLYYISDFHTNACLSNNRYSPPTIGCQYGNEKEFLNIRFKGNNGIKTYSYSTSYDFRTYPNFTNDSSCNMFNDDSWFKSHPPLWCPETLGGSGNNCTFSCNGDTKAIVYDETIDNIYIVMPTTEMPYVHRFI